MDADVKERLSLPSIYNNKNDTFFQWCRKRLSVQKFVQNQKMTVNKTAIGIGTLVLLFSTVSLAVFYWRYNKQEKPNIVFIVADDMVSSNSLIKKIGRTKNGKVYILYVPTSSF